MGHHYSHARCSSNPGKQRTEPQYLPPELISIILDAAYCQPYIPYHERRAGLCSASLVSLAWVHPAQQLLWHSLDIRGSFQLRALANSCDLKERGMVLATYTRKLTVRRRVGDPPAWSPLMEDIAFLLRRLPKVEELHLERPPSELPSRASFGFQLAVTRRPDGPRLTRLRLSFARPALVHNLLHIFPSLRFVDIQSSLSPETGSDDAPPSESDLIPHCRLYEMRWGVLSDLHIAHTLLSSSHTLRILALHSLPPNFTELMQTHGGALRSLRVFRYDPFLPQAIRHCTVLEEFIMQDHVPPSKLLAALPLTLEHLAIDCDEGQQGGLEAVTIWIATRRGRLRVLTCFSPYVEDPEWPGFVKACDDNNVELRCFAGWHGTYKNENEELGEVAQFPRSVPYHDQRLLQYPLRDQRISSEVAPE